MSRGLLTTLVIGAVATQGPLAWAQPGAAPAPPAAEAQPAAPSPVMAAVKRLAAEGKALGEKSEWTGALAKYRDAAELAESPGLRYNIAYCEEHLGKLLAAVTDYRLAQREAVRLGDADVSASAATRIAEIEPRIAALTFRRPPEAVRATIFVDGSPLADPGARRAEVDPGAHRVTALLDGALRYDEAIRVAEGETRALTLTLKPLPPPPPRPPVLGYVLGATGLLSLGAMAVFIGLRQSEVSLLDGQCSKFDSSVACAPYLGRDIDRGRLYTGVAEGCAAIGVLALGAGIYLVARKPDGAGPGPRVGFALRAGPGSILAAGQF